MQKASVDLGTSPKEADHGIFKYMKNEHVIIIVASAVVLTEQRLGPV